MKGRGGVRNGLGRWGAEVKESIENGAEIVVGNGG